MLPRRLLRLAQVLFLVLVLLVSLGLLALRSASFAEWARGRAEETISSALGRQARIEALSVHPLSLRADLRGLVVAGPPEAPERRLLSVPRATVSLRLLDLLRGRIVLDRVEAEGPELAIGRREDGSWDWTPPGRGGGARELRLDLLRVRDGHLRLADQALPVQGELRGLALRVQWSGGTSGYRGHLRIEALDLRRGAGEPLTAEAELVFRLHDRILEVAEARLEGRQLRLGATGRIDLLDGPGYEARIRGEAEAGLLAGLVEAGVPGFEGSLSMDLHLTGRGAVFSAEGEVGGSGLELDGVSLQGLSAHLSARPGILEAEGVRVALLGGEIRGDLELEGTDGQRRAEARVEVSDIDLRALLALLGEERLPLAGRFHGDGLLRWEAGRGAEAEGHLSVRSESREARPPRVWSPESEGSFRWREGRLSVDLPRARLAGAEGRGRLEVEAGPRLRAEFDFAAEDLSSAGDLAAALAAAGLFRAPKEIHPATLGGGGRARGTLRWAGPRSLRVETELDLEDIELDGYRWGAVSGRVALDPEGTRFEDLTARRDGRELRLTGRIGRSGAPGLGLSLEAEGWTVESLLEVAGLEELPVSGRGDLRVHLDGVPGLSLEGLATFELVEGAVYGVAFDALSGELRFRPSEIRLVEVVATLGPGTIAARGTLPAAGLAGGEIAFEATGVPLECLVASAGPVAPGGEIDGDGLLRFGGRGDLGINARLEGRQVGAGPLVLGDLSLELAADAHRLSLDGTGLDGRLTFDGEVDLEGEGRPLDLRLALRQADLLPLAPAWAESFPGVVPEVRADADLRVTGPLTAPEDLRVEGTLGPVQATAGYARALGRQRAPLRWEAGRFTLGPLTLENEVGVATLDLDLRTAPEPSIEASLEGAADLQLLEAFFPDLNASGRARVDLRLGGPLVEPALWGEIRLERGRFRLTGFPQPLDGVEARIELVDSVARIRSVEARLGGGTLHGEGEVALRGLDVDSYEFGLRAEAVLLRYPTGFRGQYDADLEIAGDETQALLSGEIRVIRGRYSRDLKIEEQMFTGRVREFEGTALPGFGSSLWLDLRVSATDNLWVRNDLGDLEARAELEVGGSLARPEITGRIQAFPGGRFRFRNVDYELEQGDLTLGGLRETQPRFDVRARTSVRDYEIVLSAEGTLERFDYELTSRPPLSNQDIVSLLVTGQTLEEIAGPTRQTPRGDLAAAYFGGAVGQALFGGVAQQVFGLDRFEIRPSAIGASGKPTTRITLGKRVTDDLLFLYSRDISAQEDDIYQMEYALGRALRLFAEQSGQGRYGGDLRYTHHHGARKRTRLLAEGGRELGALAGVTVEVEGEPDPEELRGGLKLKEGRPLTRALLTEAEEKLRLDLARRGYLESRVETKVETAEEGAVVVFEVKAGRRYQVVFENADKEAEALRGHLAPLWAESLFSEDLVEDARGAVGDFFRQRGYYNAYVALGEGDPRETGTIRFLVDRGPLVKVSEVRIEGNEVLPEDRIRRSMLTQASSLGSQLSRTFFRTRRGLLDPRTLDEDAAAVARLYRESGYLDARVDIVPLVPVEGDQAIVVVRIEEGDPTRVTRVSFVGLEALRPEHRRWRDLRRHIDLPDDRLLTQSLPLSLERSAVRWMDEKGYPEARAKVTIHAEEEGARIDLELLPGDYQVVGPVSIEGNRVTKEKVIRRELALEEGEPLTRADLLESQHRLYRTGLFASVRLETQPAEPGQAPEIRPILVSVQEGSRYTSLYGVGYDTEEGPRVTFGLTDGNFLGRDHVASGQIRYGSLERRAVLTWEQPRFFGTRLESLVSAFGLIEKRESFDLRRVGTTAQLTKKHRRDLTSFLNYRLDQIRVTDLEISLDEFLDEEPRLDPIRLGSLGYALAFDQRDNPFTSRKGLFTSFEARLFARPLASERDFWKLSAQGSWFQPGGPFTLATGLRLGFARPFGKTELVPIAERYFAGGASTIRGFERDTVGPKDPVTGNPLGGEGLFIFNQEARFPIWKSFHGALFVDVGNVYLRLGDFDLGDLRYTTGLSLRLGTPVGPLRVGYGYKLNRREGESKGEWYLALGQAF